MQMNHSSKPSRLVIGITGATGAIYAVRLLEVLQTHPEIETHLVVSDAGVLSVYEEVGLKKKQLQSLAHVTYPVGDISAAIASGSFQTMGMIILPCSMKTLAAVATGLSDNLISRAADVTLKERRRCVLAVRETPFNLIHCRNMTTVTEMGGIIYPPLPSFYQHPSTIAEMVDHTVGRLLDLFQIPQNIAPEWLGLATKNS